MSEVKDSELLLKVIARGMAYPGPGKDSITQERFLLAIIDLLNGQWQCGIDKDARGLIRMSLEESFPGDEDLRNLREDLLHHVQRSVDLQEEEYFRERLQAAREVAEETGFAQLEPQVLLVGILSVPSPYIRYCKRRCQRRNKRMAPVFLGPEPQEILEEESQEALPEISVINLLDVDEPSPEGEIPPPPDPKRELSMLTEQVKAIRERLLNAVLGQDKAVGVFTSGYFQAELRAMTDTGRVRPRATFLFAGPPGVGKTFLAEQAAQALGLPYARFDMSEYSDKESNLEFVGSDKVYKNGKRGNVTSFVEEHPRCVLLFDEIEKAHTNVIHLFLQILDAGRLRDSFTDEEVSFTDTILFFTTNAGKQLYEDAETTDLSGVTRKVLIRALEKDVRPDTGTPYFPAAICSRFASGNVVMFNHVGAHHLREIARREVLRNAENFQRKIGIRVRIDEPVYTALLFAEGGSADARTVKARAESFFNEELFELLRLLDSGSPGSGIGKLESVHIGLKLPKDNPELNSLFAREEPLEVLVFSSERVAALCGELSPGTRFYPARSIEEARAILHDRDISLVLVDITYGRSGRAKYLNLEDVDSKARDLFWFIRETQPEMPLYLLWTPEQKLGTEERLSFLRLGARGILPLAGGKGRFARELEALGEELHQQRSMLKLARANRLVSFETAQSLRREGKQAEILLFDFELETAVDAEDSENVLSGVSKPEVRFSQVIGAEDAKGELRYFVDYLRNPKKFQGTGVSAPKGVLLYGPPGTGKTMLAKAMAGESEVTFISAEGNQFVGTYQGVGRDRVKALFRTARKYAPAVIFIDEIDAIGKERSGGENTADMEATLTALLTEMDGFRGDTARPVFVLAATNYDLEPGSHKRLDPALLRRFDRRILVDLPTREERLRFLRLRLGEKAVFELSGEKLGNLADRSAGMSLADLGSVLELSLRSAIRDGGLRVTDEVIEEAFETFTGGGAKQWDASLLERVARHEAGHAFLCWDSGETPSYVTVVARGDHGGYMRHGDGEGKQLYTRAELLGRLRTALGGRAAELIYYGREDGVSTGAAGDLRTATNLAKQMLCAYGMDEELGLGVISPGEAEKGAVSGLVRQGVSRLLERELENAVRRLEANRGAVDALVSKLMAEEHLTGAEIAAVFAENAPGQGR